MTALIKKQWPKARPSIFEGDIFNRMFDFIDDGSIHNAWSSDPCNVYTTKEGETILEFALVGAEKEDISVTISGQTLKIEASPPKFEEEENEFYQKKIAQRSLKKNYTLHERVDKDGIKSFYKNGLLKVTIPVEKEEIRDIIVDVE